MSYWTYYLIWIVIAYGLRSPWFLLGIVVFLALRRVIPDPAVLFRTLGRIRTLRSQVEANPANVAARRDLAWIYIERKRPGRALKLLREALERTPNEAELSFLLGYALHAKRRHEEALAPLVKAVDIDPRVRFGEPYRVAGDALSALGRHEEAVDAYERFLDYNSSSVEGHLKRARVLARLGERTEADKGVDEALSTFAQVPRYARRKQLGWWLRAALARATIQRKPGAIGVVTLALCAMLGGVVWLAGAIRADLHSRHGFLPEHFGIRTFLPPPPSRDRFARVAHDPAATISKIRTRWKIDDLKRGDMARAHIGDFACRITALYGPPDSGPKGLSFTLRDNVTGAIFNAYSSEAGPAYGTSTNAAALTIASTLDEFDALLDATRPSDCKFPVMTEIGAIHVGVRDGVPFDDSEAEDEEPLGAPIGR